MFYGFPKWLSLDYNHEVAFRVQFFSRTELSLSWCLLKLIQNWLHILFIRFIESTCGDNLE